MAIFENCELEEFLLFKRYFEITLDASGTITAGDKNMYLLTLLHGKLYVSWR